MRACVTLRLCDWLGEPVRDAVTVSDWDRLDVTELLSAPEGVLVSEGRAVGVRPVVTDWLGEAVCELEEEAVGVTSWVGDGVDEPLAVCDPVCACEALPVDICDAEREPVRVDDALSP